MQVLQLIDSLEAGGAECMAVNLANALHESGIGVVLVASRVGGILESQVDKAVPYYCLDKKSTLDIKAFIRLKTIIKTHQITIIHAHSSSFFMAYIAKLSYPKLHLIWHDHYGDSEHLEQRPHKILKFCSRRFNAIISVNRKLADWSKNVLKHSQVDILTNFVMANKNSRRITKLYGITGKRVVCLANLRPQKDHFTLIKAFNEVVQVYSEWSLHLIGKDFNDEYSACVYKLINELKLDDQVFCYGSCEDTSYILSQASIGVLSSKSEGLPLALLEYGLHQLPVVTTNVGDIPTVINHKEEGLIVPPNNEMALREALMQIIITPEQAKTYALDFSHKVRTHYSSTAFVNQLNNLYMQLKDA
ncbi:glycosyltransferase [Paucihalobacter sp.]|uniref:glycosyltransferase n=1 Tax=Paucihalobacter sp. TaxID=2850405 RepID=UPI003D16039A